MNYIEKEGRLEWKFVAKESRRRKDNRAKVDRSPTPGRLLASLDRCHPKAGMRSYAKGFFANVSSSPMAAFVIPRGDQLWAGIRWTRFHFALLANCSPRRVGRKLFGGSTFLCFLDIAPIVFDTFEADCFRITFHVIVDMVGLLSYSQIWNDLEILYIYIYFITMIWEMSL